MNKFVPFRSSNIQLYHCPIRSIPLTLPLWTTPCSSSWLWLSLLASFLSCSIGVCLWTTSQVGNIASPNHTNQYIFSQILTDRHIPRRIVFTARGTLPPYQSRVFSPKETAWEKLSCPRRTPDSRANSLALGQEWYIFFLFDIHSSEMLSVMVETR